MHVDENILLREMKPDDWAGVAAVYKEGIATGNATFQQEVPAWESWDSSHVAACRIVADIGGQVAGWAALTPVSGRCVYAGVAEVSVYVSDRYRGRKIGAQLLAKLIEESEREGFWTLQAGIFPENKASVKLHENSGFRVVGYRERIGKMNGNWRDNLLLERRSTVVGVN